MSFPIRDANTATAEGGPINIQPGRPDTEPKNAVHPYYTPRILVVNPQGDARANVYQRGRKITLRGTWTLRQYRNPVECGAQFALHPGPDATYQWEVLE